MNYLKASAFLCMTSLLSCSTVEPLRAPAESSQENCQVIVQNIILKKNYEADLDAALVAKKLISRTDRFVTVQHPRLDWINRVRISLNKTLKNWNNNKYPAFYIFHEEDVVNEAKKYFKTLDSIVTPESSVAADATANLEVVTNWIKAFENYPKEMDQLLEERISLQYNLSLLKKLKLKEEVQDIKLAIKKNGVMTEEIITLRKSDKDLQFQIKKLKAEIALLDGKFFKNGKIKERVIRQAMLQDILTIIHRELEYSLKNSAVSHPELVKELERINTLIKTSPFSPTTYGIYRITNKVFIKEVITLSKLDIAYKKFIETPRLKIQEVLSNFFKKSPKEGPGILKKIYAKITGITPTQAAIGGGAVITAGIGFERYFWTKKSETTELEDQAHLEQMNHSEEIKELESEDYSQVIERAIEELTGESLNKKRPYESFNIN